MKIKHPEFVPDRYYFYASVPTGKQQMIEDLFAKGITKARRSLGASTPVKVYIYFRNRYDLTEGFLWHPGKILLQISPRLLRNKKRLSGLTGTAIHEYVHLVRNARGMKLADTVLEAAIEEGIAAFIQTRLFRAPEYLDIRTLSEKMVQTCRDKLLAALPDKTSRRKIIWTNETYREMLYRLGFGIIRMYERKHPKATLRSLLIMPRKNFVSFGEKYLKLETQKN
jgi:hypothetical protein